MKKLLMGRTLVIVVVCLVIVGLAGVAGFAATTLFTANSTVDGTIVVNPYVAPPPTPVYSATATNATFNTTTTAGAGGTASISIPTTVTVTDTSINGSLTGIDGFIVGGTLTPGLTITSTDTFPVTFTAKSATLHFTLSGSLAAGTHNLTTGSPVIQLSTY